MKPQRTDQPSNVSTEDAPRPADEHIVTSDTAEPREDDPKAAPAASSEVSTDDTAPNSSESAPDDKENQPPPKRTRRSDRKIARMSKKLSESDARDAANSIRIKELEDQVDSLKTATPKSPEPQLNDFASPREYAKAYAKWETADAEPAPAPRKDTPPRNKPAHTEPPESAPIVDEEVLEFQKRGKAKLGDEFVEALADGAAVSQVMGEYMLDSDVGPELYVHLANNQDIARKIYDSSAPRAIKLLDNLEKQAEAGDLDVGEGQLDIEEIPDAHGDATPAPDTPPEKPTRRAGSRRTAAPKPPSSTKPSGSPNIAANPEKESMDDYAERRRKEEARKRGIPV